jgi:hypothetical protein
MSENWDDDFEDVFRERLSDFEAEPPAEAWAEIASQVQPAHPWWKNWFHYLPVVGLLVGGFFVFKYFNNSQNTIDHSPQTTDHSLNTNTKFDSNKNAQSVDSQSFVRPQTKVERQNIIDHSPQTTDHSLNTNTKFDSNKNSQNPDNQIITNKLNLDTKANQEKSQNPDNQSIISPQTTDHRPQTNIKFDSNKNSQNPDNQIITNKLNLDKKANQEKLQNADNQSVIRPQTTDNRPQANIKANQEKSQNLDNQRVIRPQTTDNRPQANTKSNQGKSQNPDSQVVTNKLNLDTKSSQEKSQNPDNQVVTNKLNLDTKTNQEKTQNTDNQRVIENRISQTISLLPSRQLNILPVVNDLASKNIENMPQTNSKPRFRTPLWLSFTASPLYTFRHILPNNEDTLVITQFTPQNSFARQSTGFALNFALEKPVNQRLTVFGGASMLQIKTADAITYYNPEEVTYSVIRSDSARFSVQPNLNSISSNQKNTSQNLALQIGIQYHLGGQKIRQSVALGLGYHWLIKTQSSANDLKINQLQKQNISLNLGYVFDDQLNARWRLRVAPSIIYYLQPWFQPTAIYQTRPYHLTLQFGVSYRLW